MKTTITESQDDPKTAERPRHSDDMLTEKEAAETLRVALQTMRNWRWRGEGPRFRKLGKRTVRYVRADLAAFIEGKAAA